jgi:hypothetical protein
MHRSQHANHHIICEKFCIHASIFILKSATSSMSTDVNSVRSQTGEGSKPDVKRIQKLFRIVRLTLRSLLAMLANASLLSVFLEIGGFQSNREFSGVLKV